MTGAGAPFALALILFSAADGGAPATTQNVTSDTRHGVLVVRHDTVAPAPAPEAAQRETDPARLRELLMLARLADLGLAHVRPVDRDRSGLRSDAPRWKYKPTEYYGYHAKPDWRYRVRAGWRYEARGGWRYRAEPTWAERPGSVDLLLGELPAHGDGWYVARWR